MSENGAYFERQEAPQTVPFTAHVESIQQVAVGANPDTRSVLMRFAFPGGVVEVELHPDLAENAVELTKKAIPVARSGIIPASEMPPPRGPRNA